MSPVKAAPAPVSQSATPNTDEPLMPGVAWSADGKFLVTTEQRSLDRLRRPELSASTSFNLDPDSCMASMVAGRLLPRDDDIFEANQLGTAAHAVLEHLMSLDGPLRTKEVAIATSRRLQTDPVFAATLIDDNYVEQLTALDETEARRWYAEVDRRSLGLWDIEDPTQVHVHFNEMSFGKRYEREITIGKVPFVGFIDRVDKILNLATGEVVGYKVIDYKAGKYKDGKGKFGDDYGDQIRIYVRAVQEAEGITPESGDLYFITYGKGRAIDTSAKAISATVRRFERAWDRMHKLADDNAYPTKVGPLCSWCPLVNACPAAQAAGKFDLSDTDKDENGQRYVVAGKKKKGIDPVALGIPTLRPAAAPVVAAKKTAASTTTAGALTEVAAKRTSAATAAHRSAEPTEKEAQNMTNAPAPKVREGVNRKDVTVDGALNGSSTTATAVFQLSNLAVKHLSENDQKVDGITVNALAQTYAHIVQDVEFAFSGATSWESGLNMRVRGALATSVETLPAPWGGTVDDWDAWVTSATKRTKAIAGVAIKLFGAGTALPDRPWASLAAPQ